MSGSPLVKSVAIIGAGASGRIISHGSHSLIVTMLKDATCVTKVLLRRMRSTQRNISKEFACLNGENLLVGHGSFIHNSIRPNASMGKNGPQMAGSTYVLMFCWMS